MEKYNFHLTKKSGNKKLGKIAVTTSSKSTCPSTCPFYHSGAGGCYAGQGPLYWHWDKVSDGRRGTDLAEHLTAISKLKKDVPLRLNQAGDLPLFNRSIAHAVLAFDAVCPEKTWTYTHHGLDDTAKQAMRDTERLTVNVSCETFEQVDKTMSDGLPAVVVLPSDAPKVQKTENGNAVVVCPAQIRDTNCASCLLCAKKNRTFAIGFRAHGAKAKSVETALKMVNNG